MSENNMMRVPELTALLKFHGLSEEAATEMAETLDEELIQDSEDGHY